MQATQGDSTPAQQALKMFREGKDEHEIVDALLNQGCDLDQAKEAMNQGRKLHCAEINGAGDPAGVWRSCCASWAA